jgi:hypothetical protein
MPGRLSQSQINSITQEDSLKRTIFALGATALVSLALLWATNRGAQAYKLYDNVGEGPYNGVYWPPTTTGGGLQEHDVYVCVNTTGWNFTAVPRSWVEDAMDAWSNAAWDEKVRFVDDGNCPHTATMTSCPDGVPFGASEKTFDNQTSISMIDDSGWNDKAATCITTWDDLSGREDELREADVVINLDNVTSEDDTRFTLVHELGHVLGLGHPYAGGTDNNCDAVTTGDSVMCIWSAEGQYCGQTCLEPQLDDIAGLLFSYNDGELDGCTGLEEDAPSALFGGGRSDTNFWDFYDTNGTRRIDAADIGRVRTQYAYYWYTSGYDVFRDHKGGGLYGGNWGPGPFVNGGWGKIDAADIGTVRSQFGNSCQGGP